MSILLSAARKGLDKSKKKSQRSHGGGGGGGGKPAVSVPLSVKATGPKAIPLNSNHVVWEWMMGDDPVKVIYKKDTMEVYVNEHKEDPVSSFTDDGAVLEFSIFSQEARINSHRQETDTGIGHTLFVNGHVIPAC